eukprot:7195756-Prymnesium_polylepis.2
MASSPHERHPQTCGQRASKPSCIPRRAPPSPPRVVFVRGAILIHEPLLPSYEVVETGAVSCRH